MRLHIFALITLIGLSNGDIFTDEKVKDIREFAETLLRCKNIPGATIGVVKGNESWSFPVGYADIAAKRKVTEENRFGIGSISKSFTATLISLLIDESDGKYTFNTPVSEILGKDYEYPDKTRAEMMTIKDVLSHRTGLSSINLAVFYGGGPYGVSREDYVKQLGSVPEAKPFRDEMIYSNFIYMLAGHLTEKVWGASWEKNLKNKLFDRLGMTSTEAITKDADITGERYARPYVYLRGELVEGKPNAYMIDQFGPAGSLASTSKDMNKFMRFMLNKGKLADGTQLIKETTINTMWEPVITTGAFFKAFVQKLSPPWPVADVNMGYGLGWGSNAYRGHRYVFHPGGLHSYYSVMQIYPDQDFGLFIAVNGPSATATSMPMTDMTSLVYYITDLLLGETPWLNKDHVCSYPKPWFDLAAMIPPVPERKPVKPESPLVKYTGTYFSPLIGILIVSVDASSNQLEIRMNALKGLLIPEEGGVFAIEARDDLEFLSWPEKEKPVILHKAKFIREEGSDSYEAVDVVANPPMEPPIRFQLQPEEEFDKEKTEL